VKNILKDGIKLHIYIYTFLAFIELILFIGIIIYLWGINKTALVLFLFLQIVDSLLIQSQYRKEKEITKEEYEEQK
jgi:hypothetical protein